MKKDNPYDEKYSSNEYYWGKQPSAICHRVLELVGPGPDFRPKVLDLGCGEGRNAVFFARHGFDVTGVDVSLPGLEKTKRYAEEVGVDVRTVQADIITYEADDIYDIIFSTGTLHYLPPDIRERRYQQYQDHTSPEGVDVLSVFVRKPFLAPAPDGEATSHTYRSGELLGYYRDWEIVFSIEEIFDCMSSGIPHRHAVNRLIARRCRGEG